MPDTQQTKNETAAEPQESGAGRTEEDRQPARVSGIRRLRRGMPLTAMIDTSGRAGTDGVPR
jgi:hypothetical protein